MALSAAFSGSVRVMILSVLRVLSGLAGLFSLLMSEMFSFVLILAVNLLLISYLFLFPKISIILGNRAAERKKSPLNYVVIAGLFCALAASLLSSSRFNIQGISHDGSNTFMLLFTEYFPAIVLLLICISVIITSIGIIIRKSDPEGER